MTDNNSYDKMIIRKYDRYNKFSNGMKFFTPIQLISNEVLRLRQKPDPKKFNEPYKIRYNKQLLYVLLRGND